MKLDEISFILAKFCYENSIEPLLDEENVRNKNVLKFNIKRYGRKDKEIAYLMRQLKLMHLVLLGLRDSDIKLLYKVIE